MYLDIVSTKALGSDIEYPLRSNALSAKSILGGRVALTAVNLVAGALTEVMRRDSPMPREVGLIAEMEREVTEAGIGGWFNGNPEDVPESWSGANSDALASQD